MGQRGERQRRQRRRQSHIRHHRAFTPDALFSKDLPQILNGQPYADTLVVPPAPNEPYVRVIPLGGCGEIGRNMTLFETKDDIVAVDCGLMFPDEEM